MEIIILNLCFFFFVKTQTTAATKICLKSLIAPNNIEILLINALTITLEWLVGCLILTMKSGIHNYTTNILLLAHLPNHSLIYPSIHPFTFFFFFCNPFVHSFKQHHQQPTRVLQNRTRTFRV